MSIKPCLQGRGSSNNPRWIDRESTDKCLPHFVYTSRDFVFYFGMPCSPTLPTPSPSLSPPSRRYQEASVSQASTATSYLSCTQSASSSAVKPGIDSRNGIAHEVGTGLDPRKGHWAPCSFVVHGAALIMTKDSSLQKDASCSMHAILRIIADHSECICPFSLLLLVPPFPPLALPGW